LKQKLSLTVFSHAAFTTIISAACTGQTPNLLHHWQGVRRHTVADTAKHCTLFCDFPAVNEIETVTTTLTTPVISDAMTHYKGGQHNIGSNSLNLRAVKLSVLQ